MIVKSQLIDAQLELLDNENPRKKGQPIYDISNDRIKVNVDGGSGVKEIKWTDDKTKLDELVNDDGITSVGTGLPGQALKRKLDDTGWEFKPSPENFSDLGDVSITSLSGGEVPVYNATTSKWEAGSNSVITSWSQIISKLDQRIFPGSNISSTDQVLNFRGANNIVVPDADATMQGRILFLSSTAITGGHPVEIRDTSGNVIGTWDATDTSFGLLICENSDFLQYRWRIVDLAGSGQANISTHPFTGDGTTTSFDTGVTIPSVNNAEVILDNTTDQTGAFTVSGTSIVFNTAPANGVPITVRVFGGVDIGVPSNDTVSTVKIQNGAVTSEKIGASNHFIDLKKSTDQAIANNTFTKITFNTIVTDKSSAVSANTFTVPESGEYQFNFRLDLGDGGTATLLRGYVYVNGVEQLRSNYSTNATTAQWATLNGALSLNAGDTVDFYGWHQAGAGRNIKSARASAYRILG